MMRSRSFLPILVALTGLACFGVMDGVMKSASIAIGSYGAIFWRSVLGALFMVPIWLRRRHIDGVRGLPSPAILRIHGLRGAVVAAMAVMFFYGLVRTPMAEAMALTFIEPLIALYLAAALLGEAVGGRTVAGSLLALAGVGVIAAAKFGGAWNPEAVKGLVAILVSAVLYAWNLVIQRQQAQVSSPEEIAFFQAFVIAALLGTVAWWLAPMPDARTWLELAAAAVLAATSLMLLGWAYARAEAQVLVPMEYTAFIWAALVGWVAFREALTWHTLGGVVLIVAGCLLAARRDGPHLEPV